MLFCIYSTLNKNFQSFNSIINHFQFSIILSGPWSFGNDYDRNVVIFGVDNSSLPHADNHQNNFFVLDEGNTYGSFGAPEIKFRIRFTKKKN